MTAHTFTLNKESAIAGSGGSSRLDTTDKYTGEIILAKHRVYTKGSEGVEVTFQSDANQEARFQLVVKNAKGEEVYGYKKLQALMVCAGVNELKPAEEMIEDYNQETKEREMMLKTVYPGLKKRIGFIMQREDFTNNHNGQDAFRMNMISSFNPDTGQTAKEFLEGEGPGAVDKTLQSTKDKDTRDKPAGTDLQKELRTGFFDDDIPF